jgi:iron complex outermembrane receptor protein
MINRIHKTLLLGASPALLLVASIVAANAQSTATEAIETVTSTSVNSGFSGIMKPIEVAKERSTITQDYLVTQVAGQTIADSLNKVPGFNFTNSDPYGSSGGNIRLHGFDGNHISLTWDGMPLNDTGNYAVYTNQLPDSEDLSSVTVNQGATDVDSPSAAASGGVISMRTSRPSDTFKLMFQPSLGSFNYQRYFGRVDSGAFGPFDTTAFASFSLTSNDKFKGFGKIQKRQYNLGLYQDLGSLGFITLGMHFNSNRNNNYANVSFYPATAGVYGVAGGPAQPNMLLDTNGNYVAGGTTFASGTGFRTDYFPTCTRVSGVNGTAQSDTLCANYYGRQINPSDTGNIRISSLFHVTPDLTLTVDPSIMYTLANGGSQYTQLREGDPRLIGTTSTAGKDLNGDGDLLDTVGVFGPSNTNTIRYGLNTSLLWNVAEGHVIQLAYTLDYGLHRQTGQAAFLDALGNPQDWFAGYRDITNRVLSNDNTPIRTRDRRSHAILNQPAADYEGDFFGDTVHVSAGARMPIMTRELNQLCYLQVFAGTSNNFTPGVGFPECSTQAPATAVAANNTVTLAGFGTSLFALPAKETVQYSRLLPNLGFTYSPFGHSSMFFVDWASGISAPRTDNLYNGGNNGKCLVGTTITPTNPGCSFSSFNNSVKPETSNNYDFGFRYHDDLINASVTFWNNQFKNRIVTSFDPDQGISIDRNIGSVNEDGVDGEIAVFPFAGFSSYTSASYTHSRVSNTPDALIFLNAAHTQSVNIAGKEVVETPNWTISERIQYKIWGFNVGLGGKYTGRRFATDTNDLRVPSYVLVDGDITYDLGELGWKGSFLKFNVANLMDERYFGNISSQRCYVPNVATATSGCGSAPLFGVGYPQTFQLTLRSTF